jgi:hypothetical protein
VYNLPPNPHPLLLLLLLLLLDANGAACWAPSPLLLLAPALPAWRLHLLLLLLRLPGLRCCHLHLPRGPAQPQQGKQGHIVPQVKLVKGQLLLVNQCCRPPPPKGGAAVAAIAAALRPGARVPATHRSTRSMQHEAAGA